MAFDPDFASKILKNIGEFWQEEKLGNLTIKINENNFCCHKFHLCACSTFFKTLLKSDDQDKLKDSVSCVEIIGITPEIFGLVLKAVYKGEICMDENNMIQVWHAAHELQIDVLVSKCEDFVIAHMTLDNYQTIYQSSVLLESARVADVTLKFMAKNFDKLRKTSLFLDLPAKSFTDIVASKALACESRDQLVESILLWASHESNIREEAGEEDQITTTTDTVDKTKEDRQWVQINFNKPPAGLEDESSRRKLRQILQETERREETLGKLLNLAKLEQTSPDYLKTLMDKDWLMSNKETRNAVLTAFVTKSNSMQPATDAISSVGSENPCQDVFVYKVKESETILAYHPSTGKRYSLAGSLGNASLPFFSPVYSTPPTILIGIRDRIKFGDIEIATGNLLEGASHTVVVGKFIYCIKESTGSIYRTAAFTNIRSRSWHFVRDLPHKGGIFSLAVLHHEIVFLLDSTTNGSSKNMTIYSLNTTDLTITFIHSINCVGGFFYYLNQKLRILCLNGGVWEIRLKTSPDRELVCTYIETNKTLNLSSEKVHGILCWDNQVTVILDKIFDIHTSTPSDFMGLPLRLVQPAPSGGVHHALVHQNLLTTEI